MSCCLNQADVRIHKSLVTIKAQDSAPTSVTVLHCTACACRQALGKYAGFQLGQRKQLQEVYDELGKPTEKRSAGAHRQGCDCIKQGQTEVTVHVSIHGVLTVEALRLSQRHVFLPC
mgnify:CR=1 FL=1